MAASAFAVPSDSQTVGPSWHPGTRGGDVPPAMSVREDADTGE